MKKITIIGAGNMGGAIARGLIKGNLVSAENITISDISEKLLDKFRETSSKWNLTTSNKDAVQNADVIIIAVKPWYVENVATEIANFIHAQNQIIVSIAASVDFIQLAKFFGENTTLFRVIPNTAIEVKESVSTIATLNGNEEQIQLGKSIFDELGGNIYCSRKSNQCFHVAFFVRNCLCVSLYSCSNGRRC